MKFIHDFTLVANEQKTSDFSILTLSLDSNLSEIMPGQFVQVQVDDTPGVMLRRPISIHDVDYNKNQIKLLVQNVGKGTDRLCNLPVNSILNIIYPLGNGYELTRNDKRVLLVGGGCGVAPLLFLGRCFVKNGITPHFLIGARNSSTLIDLSEYKKLGEVMITTEDGSMGHKGFVTNHPIMSSSRPSFDAIYTCGPEAMMKALAKYAESHNIDCYVSLENRMACGIGACLCCVTQTRDGNKCTCVEGPVFDSKFLQW